MELAQLIVQFCGAHKWSSQNQGTKFVELIDGASTSYGQNCGACTTEVQNLWSSPMELAELRCKIFGAHINGARTTDGPNLWSSHKWSSHNQGTKFVELIDGGR